MPSKRKETQASTPQKKAKKDTQLQKQLKEVLDALPEVSAEVTKLLSVALPLALGEFQDQRHSYQEEVIAETEKLLGEAEASLQKEVELATAAQDTVASEKPAREQEVTDAQKRVSDQKQVVHNLKVTLAEKALAFRASRTALEQAREAKKEDGQKKVAAEKFLAEFTTALDTLNEKAALEEGSSNVEQSALMKCLKKHGFEESMLIALPSALAKGPSARGQFDSMAITQLVGQLQKKKEEQEAIIAASIPGQEKCEQAIQAAASDETAARGQQREAAQAFDAATNEQGQNEEALKAAEKALKDIINNIKKKGRAQTNAEALFEVFRDGAKATFLELKSRTTPVEIPEAMDTAEPAADVVAEPVAVAAA